MTAPDWIADVLAGRPALLTIEETAEIQRVSRRTVTRQIASGILSSVQVGAGVRIPRLAVAEFLARGA